MVTFSPARSQPITLEPSKEAAVYGLVAVAMALTLGGVFAGMTVALPLLSSGMALVLLLVQVALLLTAPIWMHRRPLNYLLFGVLPVLSGLAITPYIVVLLSEYANGGAILLNALVCTACLAAAAAVVARTTNIDLAGLGGILMMAVVGLLVLGLLQLFVPALQTRAVELLIAGCGIVAFSVFLAFDIQRTQVLARTGASPFMLALSLYLDIFNLFLYILRFMVSLSGSRD